MDILYDKQGTPVMMSSISAFFESTGKNSTYERNRKKLLFKYSSERMVTIKYEGYEIVPWGKANKFPQAAAEIIGGTSVLNTGLKFLRSLTLGQGIFPCEVTGYDARGNEQLSPIKDKRVEEFVNSRMVRRYLEMASRDYFKFGGAFPVLHPNEKGEIVNLYSLNALYCRYTLPDLQDNRICLVSGDWPLPIAKMKQDMKAYQALPDTDPDSLFEAMDIAGRVKKPLIYPLRDSWSNDDIYGEPVWLPAYILGWIDIAHLVPKFLKKAYENQTTWKWHVQIPYSYWDKKFPIQDFNNPEERKKKINAWMDEIERNLCGPENAEKPLFTNYAVNESNGRMEEEWKITALDNKYKGGENLVTSAAANSEILFALMVNPNVFGAGMPGGTYAGNQGGSNIREAFLVNIANAWIDRQCLLDPIQLIVRQRFGKDVTLRYRNTVLTTLDSGAGTTKTLS